MDAPANFSEYYKTISDSELLRILQNSKGYQAAAIAAAKQELSARQLSEAELAIANQSIQDEANQQDAVEKMEEKIRSGGRTLLDMINPAEGSQASPEKMIRLIAIVLGIMWLWNAVTIAPDAVAGLDSPYARFRFIHLRTLVLIGLTPIAIFFFWLRTKSGWILLNFLLIYQVLGSVVTLVWIFQQAALKSDGKTFVADPVTAASFSIFWVGVLYTLCRPGIRKICNITQRTMLLVLLTAIVINWFLL